MSNPISRRAALGAGIAATLGGLGAAATPAAGMVPGGAVSRPVPLSPEALLDSYVRLRARTDGKTSFGWLDALRYAVVDGEIYPLCRVLAAGVGRFTKVSDQRYDAVLLEVAHYVDMETGVLLDTLVMPGTGRVVKVPNYRTGPKRVAFGVAIDESEAIDNVPRSQLEAFAPVGTVRLIRSVSEPRLQNDTYYVRHEEYGRVTPRNDAKAARIFYREWTTWRGPSDLALDPKIVSAPSDFSYAALTSWRPWMQMGEVPGHTAENGRGSKIDSLEHIPADILRLTERLHPDLIDNPDRVLDSPPK